MCGGLHDHRLIFEDLALQDPDEYEHAPGLPITRPATCGRFNIVSALGSLSLIAPLTTLKACFSPQPEPPRLKGLRFPLLYACHQSTNLGEGERPIAQRNATPWLLSRPLTFFRVLPSPILPNDDRISRRNMSAPVCAFTDAEAVLRLSKPQGYPEAAWLKMAPSACRYQIKLATATRTLFAEGRAPETEATIERGVNIRG